MDSSQPRNCHEMNSYVPPQETSRDEEKKVDEILCATLVPESVDSSPSTGDFPDGGLRAWVVVFGVFCMYFSSLGYLGTWGLFQAYYQEAILPDYSPSELAWIGSLQHALVYLPGMLAGRLFHMGFFRLFYIPACSLIVIGTFLVPLCNAYWHFLLCQGLVIGLACGMLFAPTATILAEWWKMRRGIAIGIATSGAAVGGCFFPIVVRILLPEVGFTWTFRILGFILLFMLGISNLCIRRRLPPTKAAGHSFGLRVFKNPVFALYSMSVCLGVLGGFALFTYVSTTAISIGLSRDFAFYIVAIMNGCSGVGRILLGWLADRIGPLNTLKPMTLTVAAVTIAWPFCSTEASLVAVCVVYGLALPALSTLFMVAAAAMGEPEDLGLRMSSMITVLGIGTLCGTPLVGLLKGTDLGFKAVGFFGGGLVVLGVGFSIAARWVAAPKLISKL
ncbi:major facilitator superfamily domain-containing protein, partial [Mycena polygramma]